MIVPIAQDVAARLSVRGRRVIGAVSRCLTRPWVKAVLFVIAFLVAWLWGMPTAHAG